jgi:RNA polymerase sigma-70 factor (ECF subfamily)
MADPRTPPPERPTDAPERPTEAPVRDADAPVRDAAAPMRSADAPNDDAAAPVSSARPAIGHTDASKEAPRASKQPADASSSGVSLRELHAFLALESTQDRIRQVVRANVPPRTRRDIFDDIVQQANLRALGTKSRAESTAKLRPWISSIAKNAAIDHFRRDTVKRGWENREVDVQELPPEPADAPERPDEAEAEPWMISTWLEKRVAHHESDRRTYDLLVQKAREEKTYEELAADRGETVTALKTRVHEFKKKYLPLRRRHEERRDMVFFLLRFGRTVLLYAAAAAAILLAFLYSARVGPFAPHKRLPPSVEPFRAHPPQGEDVGQPPPRE